MANGLLSEPATCPDGVPQGSILGPPLFITYENDMGETCTCLVIILYADDTVLIACGVDNEQIFMISQHDLNK